MEDYRAIEAVVERYAKAIHDQEETEFRDLWTCEEGNILVSGTRVFRGIDSIYHEFLAGLIHDHYESIYLINDGLEIHMVTEDTAVALFEYHTECIRRDTKEPYVMKGIETQVLKKTEQGWKIFHLQYHGKDA
ncbi:MAG: DUF4440 domain-containing protein [Erysipelotrichaceae bacterium]|nr:DUF4440 domain-containing protein [Erysipelotrichaceae bacterium]